MVERFGEENDDRDLAIGVWEDEFEGRFASVGLPLVDAFVADTGSTTNVVVFGVGGDGDYLSWVGYDAKGRVAAVVTDLGILSLDGSVD